MTVLNMITNYPTLKGRPFDIQAGEGLLFMSDLFMFFLLCNKSYIFFAAHKTNNYVHPSRIHFISSHILQGQVMNTFFSVAMKNISFFSLKSKSFFFFHGKSKSFYLIHVKPKSLYLNKNRQALDNKW